MKKLQTFDIVTTALCAALYAIIGYFTSFGLSLGAVAFWPAAFIPAIFAVLFGPWVGGLGAAIGIFIRDALYTGNPLLSLIAGITSNFAMFFIIGVLSKTKLDKKKIAASFLICAVVVIFGVLLPTLIFPIESQIFAGLTTTTLLILFIIIMAVALPVFALMTKYWKEFKSFGVGAIVGQAIGAVIVSVGVWAYSLIFYGPTDPTFSAPLSASFVPIIFVWTFATEIPFVLLVSPPVIRACNAAFPQLTKRQTKESGD